MLYNDIKKFIAGANKIGLSPIEKDVLLFYLASVQNEAKTWYCEDSKVGAEINRSRNGVCAARLALKEKNVIDFPKDKPFQISVLCDLIAVFPASEKKPKQATPSSVRNQTERVSNQTENPSPKSDSPVSNQTEPVRNQTEDGQISVRNQTQPPQTPQKEYIYTTQGEKLKDEVEKGSESEAETHAPKLEHISDHEGLKIYREFYPDEKLVIFQQELIEVQVRDGPTWRKALKFWKSNNYIAKNIGKILEKYDELIVEGSKNEQPKLTVTEKRGQAAINKFQRLQQLNQQSEERRRA